MNQKTMIIATLFLLLVAGAFAAPTITVDQGVKICNKTTCDNSTKIRTGLQNIPSLMTGRITSIHVADQPPKKLNGTVLRSEGTPNGKVTIYARGMNASTYRTEVIGIVKLYYAQEAQDAIQFEYEQSTRKYPLPSWAPRPGQCDMGVRMTTSMGKIVCVRPRYGTNHS